MSMQYPKILLDYNYPGSAAEILIKKAVRNHDCCKRLQYINPDKGYTYRILENRKCSYYRFSHSCLFHFVWLVNTTYNRKNKYVWTPS